MANIHLTPISPDTDPADFIAMLEANIIGVQKNNQAVSALKRGDFARAEKLHKEALKLKVWGFGDESIQAAISYNGLGGTYLKMGPSKLDQAENSFKKALRIVDYREFGGLGKGSAQDAAMTRDNMAQLLEARGKMTEAKEMRLKGAKKGEIICGSIEVSNFRTLTLFSPYLGSFKEGAKAYKVPGHYQCVNPGGSVLPLQKLKKCDGCEAVFYCHPACKQRDWNVRHKPFCEAYVATTRSAGDVEAASAS